MESTMITIPRRPAAFASMLAMATFASLSMAHANGFDTQTGAQPFQPPFAGQPGQATPGQQAGMNDQFRQVLQQYGQIVQHPTYGEVWVPNPQVTGAGWRPYPQCHWTYDRQQQAWFFNDQTPWGQIVHHYGRWASDPSMGGFVWVPGQDFGPGWVAWRNDARSVSWAALPPEDGQQPAPEAWQTQDLQSFNSGCRQTAPAPVASYQPSAPSYAPPPSYVPQAPVYVPQRVSVNPGPIFIPDRRPDVVIIPGREPGFCIRFPLHPACRVVGPGPGFCLRFPLHPSCRVVGPGPGFCLRFPSHPSCRIVGPGPGGNFCLRFPFHPSCRGGVIGSPGFCIRVPFHPSCRFNRAANNNNQNPAICRGIVGPGADPRCRIQRPFPNAVRPFPNRPIPGVVRPFPNRPFPGSVRPFPNRPIPGVVRPFPNRPFPGSVRPFPNRPVPGMVRPFPNRPVPGMSRPFPNRIQAVRPMTRPALARPTIGRPQMAQLRRR
jgi:hypothetical protein